MLNYILVELDPMIISVVSARAIHQHGDEVTSMFIFGVLLGWISSSEDPIQIGFLLKYLKVKN